MLRRGLQSSASAFGRMESHVARTNRCAADTGDASVADGLARLAVSWAALCAAAFCEGTGCAAACSRADSAIPATGTLCANISRQHFLPTFLVHTSACQRVCVQAERGTESGGQANDQLAPSSRCSARQ